MVMPASTSAIALTGIRAQLSVVESSAITDAGLAAGARRGDGAAVAALYDRHAPALLRLAYRLTGSAQDAEDIVQDVFVGLPRALGRYEEQGQFASWLRKLTARLALSRMRSTRDDESIDESTADFPGVSHETRVIDRIELEAAIAALPETLRRVFVLKAIGELPHDDIARLLGIKRGTAEVRYHRAVKALRTLLEHIR
jgi:RNA polymerase sigma-70 factor (ECF subfamily)